MKKRLLSIVLTITLIITMMPAMALTAFAEAITVSNQEAFNKAIASATDGDVITINKTDTYTIPNISNNITIKGSVKGDDGIPAVAFDCQGSGNICSIPNNVTFENVKFDFGSTEYHGFYHAGKLVFKNCTLNGCIYGYSAEAGMEFNNCTFYAPGTDQAPGVTNYSVYTYGSNMTFTNCQFYAKGKFINIYSEAGYNFTPTIIVDSCEFNNKKDEPANKAALNVKEGDTDQDDAKILKFNVEIMGNNKLTGNFPTESSSDKLDVFCDGLVQVDDQVSEERKSEVGGGIKVIIASDATLIVNDENVNLKTGEIYSTNNNDTETQPNIMTIVGIAALTAATAATIATVALLVKKAKQAEAEKSDKRAERLLEEAKTAAKEALREAAGDMIQDPVVEAIVEDGSIAIDAATTADEVLTLTEEYAGYIPEIIEVYAAKPVQNKLTKTKAGSIKVSYSVPGIENVVGYEIERATDKNFTKNVKSYISQKPSLTNSKKLKKGTRYYYRVHAEVLLSSGYYVFTDWSNVRYTKATKTR